MHKKAVILGLVLLLAGAAAMSWSIAEKRTEQKQAAFYKAKYASELDDYLKQYNEWLQKPPEQRGRLPWGLDEYGKDEIEVQSQQKQQGRLKADMDKLAAGERDVYPFADVFYGDNWQDELSKYKERKEQREFILTCSIVSTSAGGAIFGWYLLLWTARRIIRVFSHLKKFFADFFRSRKETGDKPLPIADAQDEEENSEHRQEPYESRKTSDYLRDEQQIQLTKHSDVLTNSGWHSFEGSPGRPYFRSIGRGAKADKAASGLQNIAVQLPDEDCTESTVPSKVSTEGLNQNTVQLNGLVQNVQQSTLQDSEPLGNSLRELTQHMSAIREYASQQQDRVEKLQEGYDWGIIRTFCLRVIRCIDNLEERINRFSEQGDEAVDLRELRDELLFALESSGIEQFEPEIDSDFRGQERCAEAVKDRQDCDDPDMTGKIAKVIKPGYQYVIDQESIKVVRTAQVKLYN